MNRVSPLVSRNISNYLTNKQTWGGILYNVKSYGAKGDGVTDDTAAINSAIANIISAGGGTLFFPRGTYIVTGGLTETTVTMKFEGVGATATKIQTSIDGINVITISSYFCYVTDMEIAYTGATATSGSGILLNDLDHTTIERCNIHGFYINIDTLKAAYWTIFNNLIYDPVKYNIRVQNTTSADEGDSEIIGNKLFANGNPNIDAHIYQSSSGGLRVIGNKFLYGKIGIQSEIIDGVITSILLINANSVELQSVNFVKVKRLNLTGVIDYIAITGNEFRSDSIAAGIILDDGTTTCSVTGNIMHGQNTGTAIQVNNSAKDVTIDSNVFKIWSIGIQLNYSNGNNARATIGTNQFADTVTYNYKNIGYIQDTAIENENMTMNNVVATDNVTYQNVYQIDLSTFTGAYVEIDIYGIVTNSGSFTRRITKILNRESSNIVITAGADAAAGVAIDVNFDVTTVSGSVIMQVRKSGTTGNALNGTAAIKVRGDVVGFKAFDTV